MIDILVVSHACITAINRLPYRLLADMGWNIEIVTAEAIRSKDIQRRADPPSAEDPPMHFLPLRGSNLRLWRFAGLRDLIARRRPRIVMLDYDPGTLITLEAGYAARANEARVACLSYDNIERSVTDEFKRSPVGGLRAAAARAMSIAARRVVDHVFVLSSDSAHVMEKFGFRDRVSRIPLGFSPAIFKPDAEVRARVRAKLGLSELTFAYFGRVIPEKGAHYLIEALHRLRHRSWQLLMDRFSEYRHPYVSELAALIERLGLHERIVYFDASHDQIGDYMNAADVVVMPSTSTGRWKEQYGRVAAEAMACGRLVIASDSGSLPELVGDAGIIVPQKELPELDRQLARVLDEPGLVHRFGSRASARALSELSIPVQCARMHEQFMHWATPNRVSATRNVANR